jgi:RNA polymerase sigma-70 factor (ECF subfamily)
MSPNNLQTGAPFDPTVWVDSHGDFLFAFAVSRVRDETVAEDLVQETLLAAMQSQSAFRERSSERTWLCGILKHKIIDHYRRSCREVEFDGDPDISEGENLFQTAGPGKGHWTAASKPVQWAADPEAILESSEFRIVLTACIGKLPDRVASVFTLREVDGYETAEICEFLAITPSNLWVMLHRARLHLRRCIDFNWFRKVTH